ncbi:MAG: transcriptional regulator [Planctomycetes bacterium]|nr:transcriptional regulator [Planctomycetota bacterium]
MAGILSPESLDKIIHERARLGIVACLAARGAMTFSELRETLEMTDGNLSVHARTLEEAGYIAISKEFVGRKPRTTMTLTVSGQKAFRLYVDHLERIVFPRRGRKR